MDGLAGGTASDHDRLGRFKNGNSEHLAKRRRIAERVRQLAVDYDDPSQQLLKIIAVNLDDAERSRTHEKRTRAANAANRLMKQLRRKEAPLRTITEIMAGVGK